MKPSDGGVSAVQRVLLIVAILLSTIASARSGYCQESRTVSNSTKSTEHRHSKQSAASRVDVDQTQPAPNARSNASPTNRIRLNNLDNLENLLNIIVNVSEVIGIAIGGLLVPVGLVLMFLKTRVKRWIAVTMIIAGPIMVFVSMKLPDFVNWLVARATDANII